MSLFSKLYGTISPFFQIGGPAGPGLNNNAGTIEAKNAANSAFVTVSGALPTADAHFATKAYVDTTANKPVPVSLQISGATVLPSNSATEQWYLVTTTGGHSTIGQILWDDGSSTGTVQVMPAVTGQTVITTTSFIGGTITFGANQLLIWTGSAWSSVIPSISGAKYEISMTITNAASQSSATSIPANAVITGTRLLITTPYSAGATIAVGQTGTTNLLMLTGDNTATVSDEYQTPQTIAWGSSALPVLVTIAGAPSAGAGQLVVDYCVPNS
jgi:hypothetical protein